MGAIMGYGLYGYRLYGYTSYCYKILKLTPQMVEADL
jgi:hypothetical protein